MLCAIEGGGTSWVTALVKISGSELTIVERASFATETPEVTLSAIRAWLNTKTFDALGIASFGPVDCKFSSPSFGFITSTPKPNWANTDVLRLLGLYDEFLGVPFKFDTDVNAPAMAEYTVSASAGQSSCAYVTVGTGVGVGLVINGKTVHGLMHPEAGHIQVLRRPGDTFEGNCPFHGCCVEGMCSTGSLSKRKGCTFDDLPSLSDDDELWDVCAYYVAQLCATLLLTVSPERIVLGGGVMQRKVLYGKVREQTARIINGYVTTPAIDTYITPSTWLANGGIMGAAYLARLAWQENS